MRQLLVLVVARLFVLGQRRAAAWTPLRGAMALVKPSPLVDRLQEPPDVFDVRVTEREVRVLPVHPHAEALRLVGDHTREVRDALLASLRELRETVFLDV